MRHLNDGTLRRLLDEPAGVADADREHATGCAVCLSRLAAAQLDADVAGAALRQEVTTDVEQGWRRLSGTLAADKPRRAAAVTGGRRWRTALRSPVIAAVAVVTLVTGAGVAAATDWLQVFRTKQIAPVTAPKADLVRLPDLSAFGRIEVTEKINVRKVADAAAAQSASGLAAPRVSQLPRGVTGEPNYLVGARVSATFTFSVATAAQTAAAAGQTLPPPPSGLDGSQFRLVAGPGLAAVWSEGREVPSLIIGRVVAPTAYSSGMPFATARDYLLSLPMLPKDIAEQLRGFSGDGDRMTTLPLFVATENMTTSTADVGGVQATVLTSRTGVMAGVVWVQDGVVTAVAGSMTADEVLSVARGLR